MTSPLHGEDREFESHWVHFFLSVFVNFMINRYFPRFTEKSVSENDSPVKIAVIRNMI